MTVLMTDLTETMMCKLTLFVHLFQVLMSMKGNAQFTSLLVQASLKNSAQHQRHLSHL